MASGTIHKNVSTDQGINSSLTPQSGVSITSRSNVMQTTDDLVFLFLKFDITAEKHNNDVLITGVPVPPKVSTPGLCPKNDKCYSFSVNPNGSVTANQTTPAATWYTPLIIYPRN